MSAGLLAEFIGTLCEAFDEAKALAYQKLQNERMTSLPLMRSYLDETVEVFGNDPWAYGVERNWAELQQFLSYAHEQGLTQRRLVPEDLFHRLVKDFRFQAKIQG